MDRETVERRYCLLVKSGGAKYYCNLPPRLVAIIVNSGYKSLTHSDGVRMLYGVSPHALLPKIREALRISEGDPSITLSIGRYAAARIGEDHTIDWGEEYVALAPLPRPYSMSVRVTFEEGSRDRWVILNLHPVLHRLMVDVDIKYQLLKATKEGLLKAFYEEIPYASLLPILRGYIDKVRPFRYFTNASYKIVSVDICNDRRNRYYVDWDAPPPEPLQSTSTSGLVR